MNEHRFICHDCGVEVIQLNPHDTTPVCMECRFIRTLPDPKEKEEMRQILRKNLPKDVAKPTEE